MTTHRVRAGSPNQPGKGGQVVSMAVVVDAGVTARGEREILGLDIGDR